MRLVLYSSEKSVVATTHDTPTPLSDAAFSAGPLARRSNADDAEKADYRRSFEECAVHHRSGFNMVPLQIHSTIKNLGRAGWGSETIRPIRVIRGELHALSPL